MRWADIMNEDVALGRVIAAAIRAKKSLSDAALYAVEKWQISNWETGALSRAFAESGSSDIRREIEAAFEPVRDVLRAQFGDTIKLYRGQIDFAPGQGSKPGRMLFSWTTDRKVAMQFAYNLKRIPAEITDERIQQAVATFNRTGYVKFGQYSFLRMKDDPDYYLIYRGRDALTDGDDLEAHLRAEQRERRETIENILQSGSVFERDMPIDDIVWVVNDYNCKEFICRANPLA